MKKRMSLTVLTAVLMLAARSQVWAQTPTSDRLFIDLNAGVQTWSPVMDTNTSVPLYGETAGIATRQDIGSHPVFDVRVGYRANPHFGVALAVSGFQSGFTGAIAASIPSPVLVGKPTTSQLQAPGLNRRDLGYHVQAIWFVPVSEKIDLALSGGPSFVHVQQPIIQVVPVAGTQSVAVAVSKDTGLVKGGNVAADATYALSTRYGVGVFVRYAGGSADFADLSGVTVRSLQTGGGLRVRF